MPYEPNPIGNAFPGPPKEQEPWRIDTQNPPAVSGSDHSQSPYDGSMQQILQQNLGYYVGCDFLVGTQEIVHKEGILYSVGISFLVLYETFEQRYVVCDFYMLKFVTFYEPGREPRAPADLRPRR